MAHLPSDKEAYAKNMKEQYEALGRFVEAFEMMVNEVRETAIESLCRGVKASERIGLLEIAFHHQAMTAKPLYDIMRAIIAEAVNDEKNFHYANRALFKSLLGFIFQEYDALTWKRNDLLHGTWLIGYASIDDPDAAEFYVRKCKTTADGLTSAKELPKNVAELNDLIERCDVARSWIGWVDHCLGNNVKLTEFFQQVGTGKRKRWYFTSLQGVRTTLPLK